MKKVWTFTLLVQPPPLNFGKKMIFFLPKYVSVNVWKINSKVSHFLGGGGFGPKVWKFTLFLFFLNETFPKSLFPSNNGMEFYIQISFHLWLLGHSDLSISGKLLESICELSTVIVISFPKRYQCYLSPKSLVVGGWWWVVGSTNYRVNL